MNQVIYAAFPAASTTRATISQSKFVDGAIALTLPEGYTSEHGEWGVEIKCAGHTCSLGRELVRINLQSHWEYSVSSPFIDPATGQYKPPVKVNLAQ